MDERVEAGSFFWVEESEGDLLAPLRMKRKVKSKKLEFVGWGSRPLIEFLGSIGKDINNQISQYDVTDIINKYISDNSLLHPTKKKRVVCDEKLYHIFGRKTISRIKIYDLLGTHYAENQDNSDDDFFCSLEEEDTSEMVKIVSSEKKIHQKKEVQERPKSLFAAVIPDNIKLVYLKKSLVLNLLQDFGSFETKVVGSFVRIKSDPNDYRQKNPYQLVQVIGLKVSGQNDRNNNVLLQVPDFTKDIHISLLSDDNFSQEECEDLRERIKDGLLKRPTVVELEVRARILHEDIMKRWLAEELSLLEKLIARANEKGWRKELSEYLERRQLLQSPDEQGRLLGVVPNVVANELETETAEAAEQIYHDDKCEDGGSAISTTSEASDVLGCNIASNADQAALRPLKMNSSAEQMKQSNNIGTTSLLSFRLPQMQPPLQVADVIDAVEQMKQSNNIGTASLLSLRLPQMQPPLQVADVIDAAEQMKQSTNFGTTSWLSFRLSQMQHRPLPVADVGREVIQVSDDDDEAASSHCAESGNNDVCMSSLAWHYADPQGDIQGPFSLQSLKRWKDANYFPHDFKVWKSGQTAAEAVVLNDLLPDVSSNNPSFL